MVFNRKDYAGMNKGIPFVSIADHVGVNFHLRGSASLGHLYSSNSKADSKRFAATQLVSRFVSPTHFPESTNNTLGRVATRCRSHIPGGYWDPLYSKEGCRNTDRADLCPDDTRPTPVREVAGGLFFGVTTRPQELWTK